MADFKTIRRRVRYTLVYGLVRTMIWTSGILPRQVWLTICGWLGSAAYYLANETRKLTIKHLGMAFPEKSPVERKALAKSTFTMLGKNAGDVIRASSIKSLPDLEKILVTHGLENFENAYKKGKGVIFIACHLGAFDLQVMNIALRGFKPNVLGAALKDKRLNDLLFNYRMAHGAIAIERGKETFRMIKVLKSGGMVALLIDQDTKVKSVFVDFFGMPAATPAGATVLALKTGASVVPSYNYLAEDGKQHQHLFPEIPMQITGNEENDIVYNTQVLTKFIEDKIRKHPDQWVWMHERWKTKPGDQASDA